MKYENPETGETVEWNGSEWVASQTIGTTGAPLSVRGVVGPESRKPEDRLRTLQQYYPDAVLSQGNMVFSDPTTGKPTYYNPPGLDVGDVVEQGRLAGEAVGGIGAAMAAGGTGAGIAAVPMAGALGAEAGGSLFDAAMHAMTPRVETRTPAEQASEGLTNVGVNMAGEGIAARLLPGFANLMRGRPTQEQQILRGHFESEGIPTGGAPGAISGLPAVQSAENALTQMPTSSKLMQGKREETFGALQDRMKAMTESYGTPKPTPLMGEEIAASAAEQLKKFDDRAKELTNSMAEKIGFDNVSPATNLTAVRDRFKSLMEESPSTYGYLKGPLGEISGFLDEAVEKGGMPIGLINRKRSVIGEDLKSPQQSGYTKNQAKAYREIYGAAAQDIEEAAALAGPEARQALELQKRYIRQPKSAPVGTKKPLVKELESLASDTGMQAYNKMMNAAKAGPQTLQRMRKSMDMDTWNDFRATVLDDMGKANPGAQGADGDAFSVNTFLTNWNKLPESSRDMLFGGKRYGASAKSLDKLAKITESLKDTDKLRNYSNTGAFNMWYTMLTGGAAVPSAVSGDMASAVGTMAGMFGLPYLSAKTLTSPAVVRFLTEPVEKGPGAFANAVARTTARVMQEETDPEVKRDWFKFMSTAQEAAKTVGQGNQQGL